MKFEVGKKYKGLLNPSCICECLFVSPKGHAILKNSDGDEHYASSSSREFWLEYREPVKRWFNKYSLKDGSVKIVGKSSADDKATSIYGFLSLGQAETAAPNHPPYWTYLGAVEIEF